MERKLFAVAHVQENLQLREGVRDAGLLMIGTLATTLRWVLLRKGMMTHEELTAAEQEMRAAAEVDSVFDPKSRELDNALKEIREQLNRWMQEMRDQSETS